jgi:hypothetical protein
MTSNEGKHNSREMLTYTPFQKAEPPVTKRSEQSQLPATLTVECGSPSLDRNVNGHSAALTRMHLKDCFSVIA